jgi:hypothetical protein
MSTVFVGKDMGEAEALQATIAGSGDLVVPAEVN